MGDGRIVAVGQSNTGGANDFAIARYKSDGSLDGSGVKVDFGGDDSAYAVTLVPGGGIVAAGASDNNFAVLRYYRQRLYAQQDANYNVTSITDASGAVQERYLYDPYGAVLYRTPGWSSTSSGFSWVYLHQGGRYDGSSKLYAFRRRDYSPTLGRWTANDPLGVIDGQNKYLYVRANPITLDDPFGLQATTQQPEPVKGSKPTEAGTFNWTLLVYPQDDGHPQVQFRLVFTPDKTGCAAAHVAFVQVVLEFSSGGEARYPLGQDDYFKQFVSGDGSWVDHTNGAKDPFYNATLKNEKWVGIDAANKLGNGPREAPATMVDSPGHAGNHVSRWETTVVDVETGKTYGGVQWGYKSTMSGNPVLDEGRLRNPPKISDLTVTFVETPSAACRSAVKKWNEVAKEKKGWSQVPLK